MKHTTRMASGWTLGCVAIAAVVMTVASARADVIYADDFSGSTNATLNGTTPDVTPGETWTAGEQYKADGSFVTTNSGGAMTLPFTPEPGEVYSLDATVDVASGASWACFGYGTTQPTTGYAAFWSKTRAAHFIRVGPGQWVGRNGTGNGGSWTTLASETGLVDVRIVLDTTGGSDNWKVTWYAKLPASDSYAEVYATLEVMTEDISSVGFGANGNAGSVTRFQLSTPPPSGMLVIIK
jgi:hypothetical protein